VLCGASQATCAEVSSRLRAAGAELRSPDLTRIGGPGRRPDLIQVEVGTWQTIRADQTARLLGGGPDGSGVFARFVGDGRRPLLELDDERGEPAGTIGKGGGLVAALRPDDGPPTWIITGTDAKGVTAAAGLLGPPLRNRYAVATQPGAGPTRVPVP
jgi:hypothetical protein